MYDAGKLNNIFKLAHNMFFIEKAYAEKAVEVYGDLLSELENRNISSKTVEGLLDILHFRYGGDRKRFFNDPEYRTERMACTGSNSFIYEDLIYAFSESS